MKKKRATQESLDLGLPEILRTPKFERVWQDWLADRKERKIPVTSLAAKMQLTFLARLAGDRGIAWAVQSVEEAIFCGYRGVFTPKSAPFTAGGRTISVEESVELARRTLTSRAFFSIQLTPAQRDEIVDAATKAKTLDDLRAIRWPEPLKMAGQ